MRASNKRAAFTLVELLVVMGIIALLMGILIPTLGRSRESANRIKCANNLKQFGVAMTQYATDNNGMYPRTYYDTTATTVLDLKNTGFDDWLPFVNPGLGWAGGTSDLGVNNVPAAIFLLVRNKYLTPDALVCPSMAGGTSADDFGGANGDPNPLHHSNFTNLTGYGNYNLSYSMQNPYPQLSAVSGGWTWGTNLEADYVLAADIAPNDDAVKAQRNASGTITTLTYDGNVAAMNSASHRRGDTKEGQNVLYADGHVEFQTTPYCGVKRNDLGFTFRDNIYTANDPTSTDEKKQYLDNTVNSRASKAQDNILLPFFPPAVGAASY